MTVKDQDWEAKYHKLRASVTKDAKVKRIKAAQDRAQKAEMSLRSLCNRIQNPTHTGVWYGSDAMFISNHLLDQEKQILRLTRELDALKTKDEG